MGLHLIPARESGGEHRVNCTELRLVWMFKYQGQVRRHGAGEPGRERETSMGAGQARGGRQEHGGGAGQVPGRLMHKLHPLGRGSNSLLLTGAPSCASAQGGVFFFSKDFFDLTIFKSLLLYLLQYYFVSMFGVLATGHVGAQLANQRLNLYSCVGRRSP